MTGKEQPLTTGLAKWGRNNTPPLRQALSVAGNLTNQHFNSIIFDKLKNVFLKIFRSIIFCLVGLLLLIIFSRFQQVDPPKPGEYYYSSFLNNNYTFLFGVVLFLVGLLIGYLLRYNPWLAGLSLILIYPVTSLYEATVFKGSHNLIPFEFFVFFAYSLPAVLGVYLGKYIFRRTYSTKLDN